VMVTRLGNHINSGHVYVYGQWLAIMELTLYTYITIKYSSSLNRLNNFTYYTLEFPSHTVFIDLVYRTQSQVDLLAYFRFFQEV